MKKFCVVAGILCALALLAGAAGADVIATRVRTDAFSFSVPAAAACPGASCPFLPLNNANSTSMIIVTTVDNQRVVVQYHAECTVTAPSTTTWVSLSIFVDGVLAAPSSTDQAHCTSNNNGANWVSAVTSGVFVVPDPGLHIVQVRGQILNGAVGNTARIDDTTLVVMK